MESFDISRVGFDPLKHYSGVRMQQGRVITDDDYNENGRIEGEEERRKILDMIGPAGSPDNGFQISNLRYDKGFIDFNILPGTFYAGGLRFEMEQNIIEPQEYPATEIENIDLEDLTRLTAANSSESSSENTGMMHARKGKTRRVNETYRGQKDWIQQDNADTIPAGVEGDGRYDLVYLEGWQQAVSAAEDNELLETALGGPDTGVRIRNMRRIRIQPDIGAADCADAWKNLSDIWKNESKGVINREHELTRDMKLTVSFLPGDTSGDLCSPSMSGGYLGAENQAIRVQLTGKNKFTWGFDNASPLYRVTVDKSTVKFLHVMKDQHHWPVQNQVVEILPWSAVLGPNGEKIAEQSGFLDKVETPYDPDLQTIILRHEVGSFNYHSDYYFLRVWNRGSDYDSEPEIDFVPGHEVKLGNTGLAVTFNGTQQVVGDYWVIAARPHEPNRVVPWKLSHVGAAPAGIRRFYAPLALIHWYHDRTNTITGEIIHDCRRKFRPLTDLKQCCTFTVGDGIQSHGDYNSVGKAVKNLPPEGGRICLLPGTHNANLHITGKMNVEITGCGKNTIVQPEDDRKNREKPIFRFTGCSNIEISNLTLISLHGTAIQVTDTTGNSDPLPSCGVLIRDNQILAFKNAIRINVLTDEPGEKNIRILNNLIGMIDSPGGGVAIFSVADDLLIEGNRIVTIPKPEAQKPGSLVFARDWQYMLYDPCKESKGENYPRGQIKSFSAELFLALRKKKFPVKSRALYETRGGIQVGCTSDRVRIINNDITGGAGNGITLGHFSGTQGAIKDIEKSKTPDCSLYNVHIEGNRIERMGQSGIGDAAFAINESNLMINLQDINIFNNSIINCVKQIPVEAPVKKINDLEQETAFGGIVLSSCDNCTIKGNHIENNGTDQFIPACVCGIFILIGDGIDISGNHIINNGPGIVNPDRSTKHVIPNRGGIVVSMSLKRQQIVGLKSIESASFDGFPAAVIQGNIVTQPLGHALLLVAMGPVLVSGNVFTSQGIDKTNLFSLLAGCVFILNLGISKDFLVLGKPIKFSALAAITKKDVKARKPESLIPMQYLPGGNVMFSNNQSCLDLREKSLSTSFSSQLIASMDDITFNGNQSECLSYATIQEKEIKTDTVHVNTAVIGFTVRPQNNRFQEGTTDSLWSLLSFGRANITTGNIATHCIVAIPTNIVLDFTNTVLYGAACSRAARDAGSDAGNSKKIKPPSEGFSSVKNIPPEGITNTGVAIEKLDGLYAEKLDEMRVYAEVKERQRETNAEDLFKKYGEDDGRGYKISQQVTANKMMVKSMKTATQKTVKVNRTR